MSTNHPFHRHKKKRFTSRLFIMLPNEILIAIQYLFQLTIILLRQKHVLTMLSFMKAYVLQEGLKMYGEF